MKRIRERSSFAPEKVNNASMTPARVHTKTHLHYHARIQKKWNKRFGYAEIVRGTDTGFAALDSRLHGGIPHNELFVLSGRPRQRTPRRPDGHFVDPVQNLMANEADLRKLCDDMIAQVREGNHTACIFQVADEGERAFIAAYMLARAPDINVTIQV